MKILKTVGAAATLLAAGLAYAAVTGEVSASWNFTNMADVADQAAATSSTPDAFSSTSLSLPSTVTVSNVRYGSNATTKTVSFKCTLTSTLSESNYVSYTVTPNGLFQPKSFTMDGVGVKTGAVKISVAASNGGAEVVYLQEQKLVKSGDTANENIDGSISVDLSSMETSNNPLTVKVYVYGDTKAREFLFSNPTITGTLAGGGTPVNPSIPALAAPQIAVTDEGVVTIAGPEGATVKYTTDGTEPSATVGETYTAPFTLTESATVKAISLGDGENNLDSKVASQVWTPIVAVNGYVWYVNSDGTYTDEHDFFTEAGSNGANFAWSYNGITSATGLKMNSSGKLEFTTDKPALVTIVQSPGKPDSWLKLDQTSLKTLLNVTVPDNKIYKLYAAPGHHVIAKDSGEAGLAYVAVEYVEPYTLPTDADMNFNNANIFKARENSIESEGAALGSTQASTQAQFFVSNTVEQPYYLQFMAGHGQGAGSVWNATVKSVAADGTLAEVAAADFTIPQTNGWTPQYQCELPIANLPAGNYEVTLTAKSTPEGNSYAGNIGALRISTESAYNTLPGQWNLGKALVANGVRYEVEKKELGYVKNGTSATYTVNVAEPGEYTMIADFSHYNNSFVDFTVTDIATGQVEATASIERTAATTAQHIRFNGAITAGLKTVEMKFTSASDGYLFNLSNVSFEHSAELKQPHLCGEMNGWSTDNEAYLFTSTDDVHYTLRLPRLYGAWKITLDGWHTAAGEQALATDMPLTADNSAPDFTLWSQSETLLTLTLGADGTPATLRVDGQYAHPVYFCGEQTQWLEGKKPMIPMGDNVYELTIPEGLSGEWKLNDGTWDWNFGTTGIHEGDVMLDWKENEVWFGKDNFKHLTTGSTFIRFTLVEGTDNADSWDPSIIWIQEEGNIPVYLETPDFWDEVRIHFWNGSHDTTWPGAAMHAAGTYADSSISLMAEGEPQILEIALPAGTDKLIFNNNDKGEQTENLDVYPGHIYRLTKNADGSIAATHSLYNGTTGVEDVTVEAEAQSEYYDLRGIRVTNPQPGHIYIVRQGAKTSKVRF